MPARLERLREQLGLRELAVYSRSGQLLAFAGGLSERVPPSLGRDSIAKLRPRQTLDSFENDGGSGLVLKSLLIYRNLDSQQRVLQALQSAPGSIAQDAEQIETARAEYRQLLLGREGLTTFYMLTLALSALLALTAALAFALFLSERLSAPLSNWPPAPGRWRRATFPSAIRYTAAMNWAC